MATVDKHGEVVVVGDMYGFDAKLLSVVGTDALLDIGGRTVSIPAEQIVHEDRWALPTAPYIGHREFHDTFVNAAQDNFWTNSTAGTSAGIYLKNNGVNLRTSDTPGVMQMTTGSTTTGSALMRGKFTDAFILDRTSAGEFGWQFKTKIRADWLASDCRMLFGWSDITTTTGTPNQGVWVEVDRSINDTWRIHQKDSVGSASAESIVTFANDTTYECRIGIEDGDTNFYLDDVLVIGLDGDTTVPDADDEGVTYFFQLIGAGTTWQMLYIDYLHVWKGEHPW